MPLVVPVTVTVTVPVTVTLAVPVAALPLIQRLTDSLTQAGTQTQPEQTLRVRPGLSRRGMPHWPRQCHWQSVALVESLRLALPVQDCANVADSGMPQADSVTQSQPAGEFASATFTDTVSASQGGMIMMMFQRRTQGLNHDAENMAECRSGQGLQKDTLVRFSKRCRARDRA